MNLDSWLALDPWPLAFGAFALLLIAWAALPSGDDE